MSKNKELHEMSSRELGQLFPIIMKEANPNWKNFFDTERDLILAQFKKQEIERIEHIGSTAIPDLKAKPSIDILMEISQELKNEKIIHTFQDMGYEYIRQTSNPPPHMMFVKGYTKEGFKGQAYHIHVRYQGDWNELYFRDYLRKNEKVRKEYERLKLKLSEKFKNDREAYTNAKTSFIKTINKRARQEKK